MGRASYVYAFISLFVVTFLGGLFGVSFPATLIFSLILGACFFIFPLFRINFSKPDVNKIEQFLLKNKRNPIYMFYFGLANENEEAAEEAIRKINQGLYLPSVKKQHQLIHAYFKKQPDEMEKLLRIMKKSSFTLYYQTVYCILNNNLNEARSLIDQNPKTWMREALTAELLTKENRQEGALPHVQKALALTRGLQHYILWKNWEREYKLS